jgi:hypothetical protein
VTEEWLAKVVYGISGLLVTWGTWLTVKSFGTLSRDEHERLCEKRQREVDEQLARLEKKQDETLSLLIDIVRKGG